MHIIDNNLPREKMDEYLRRNLLHASSVGANANAKFAKDRLLKTKRPSKWLIEILSGIIDRTERVHKEMAAHRDEIIIYVEVKK